jgi:predicted aldo/keto reductase-like oxidoreductase
VLLASKQSAGASTKRAELFETLEGSLRRLRTDHIDVYFNHAVNDPARLRNPEWYEFAARAKQQGKIRFTGMSGHGGRLVECLDLAVDGGLVDVVLVGTTSARIRPSFRASRRASTSWRCRTICRACCARRARRAWAWWR